MNKSITGYRMLDKYFIPRFIQAVYCILTPNVNAEAEPRVDFDLRGLKAQGLFIERLQDAGVLDIWFEPVYAEEDESDIVSEQQRLLARMILIQLITFGRIPNEIIEDLINKYDNP